MQWRLTLKTMLYFRVSFRASASCSLVHDRPLLRVATEPTIETKELPKSPTCDSVSQGSRPTGRWRVKCSLPRVPPSCMYVHGMFSWNTDHSCFPNHEDLSHTPNQISPLITHHSPSHFGAFQDFYPPQILPKVQCVVRGSANDKARG